MGYLRNGVENAVVVLAFVIGALVLFFCVLGVYIARRCNHTSGITGFRKVCVVCSVLVIVLLLLTYWLGGGFW